MASTFAQRLDFLMRLTNTQNSALARELNFDASYISRIRSGRRGMPRHQPFVEPAATYFARSLSEPYQRNAAADAICPSHEWPEDQRVATSLLVTWLRDEGDPYAPVDHFLEGLAGLAQPCEVVTAIEQPAGRVERDGASDTRTSFYYGDNGKREAVEEFLSELAALNEPTELLLLSDEHMAWLYDDPAFEKRWATSLMRIISQGGRMRIVHTVSRDLGQMLEGIEGWLPLYMTGAIEPWWYPNIRDEIYRRTLFIARGRSAVISSSIGDDTSGMLNMLLRDAEAASALEREYNNYLTLCRPLMRFEMLHDSEALSAWLTATADDIRKSDDDVMLRDTIPNNFVLLARQGKSATLFRMGAPTTVSMVSEWSMASSFWEHLRRTDHVYRGRDEVADRLGSMASQLV